MTLQAYQMTLFNPLELSTLSVEDFRARLSRLQGIDGDSKIQEIFEIARFASILKPRILFLENVKGLLNHDKGRTFETILETLDELGYNVEWQVLNSKDFGVPQNRERVFIIGHLRGECGRKVFPIGEKPKKNNGLPGKNITTNTLTARYEGVANGSYIVESKQKNVIRIRKLTPKECWRLQGFPDWAFERAAKVNSNSQLYKQAGNSVTVNVIEAIAKEL